VEASVGASRRKPRVFRERHRSGSNTKTDTLKRHDRDGHHHQRGLSMAWWNTLMPQPSVFSLTDLVVHVAIRKKRRPNLPCQCPIHERPQARHTYTHSLIIAPSSVPTSKNNHSHPGTRDVHPTLTQSAMSVSFNQTAATNRPRTSSMRRAKLLCRYMLPHGCPSGMHRLDCVTHADTITSGRAWVSLSSQRQLTSDYQNNSG
jgi:hypothetical protein